MSPQQYNLDWHLRLPVCETRTGCSAHLRHTPWTEFCKLCTQLDCTADTALDKLWARVKAARGRALSKRTTPRHVTRQDRRDRQCRGQKLLFKDLTANS